MNERAPGPILVLAPHGRDAAVICRVLDQAALRACACADLAVVHHKLPDASAVVLTEEALAGPALPSVLDWVARQPPWSDLPFIVLVTKQATARAGRRAATLESLGNAVLLERPLNAESLGSAGRSAARARRRQLAMRDLADTLETRVHERTRALAETEAQFRAVFEGFPESLFVIRVEPDGRFIYERRNPAAIRRTGLPDDRVAGRQPGEFMEPAQADTMLATLRQCVETGNTLDFTETMRFPAGTATFDVTLTPMRGDGSRVTRILGSARDVTERNQLEQRLRQAQKMEAVGQLTGGVAHDFNNLLQVVLSGLTLMERVQDPARRLLLAESVRRAAQRGGDLTKRLLTVARRQSLRPQPIDIAAWLQDGAGNLLERALRGDIVTRRELPPHLPPIEADPGELELAVLNLAVNARDAMPSGGTLTIAAEAVSLDGSVEADGLAGRFVRLSVGDTGTGMDAQTQARVFEPFFTTKSIGKGTGLGLAQVYGFAKQSGGGVRLHSAPGEGTTVALLLPVSLRAIEATAPEAEPEDRPLSLGAAVLVVEDDEDVAALVVDMLTQLGHHPTRVTTASAALGALADGRPVDLLFTDVLMPGGMDGLALAREAARRRPGLRVLLTTGYTGGGAAAAPLGLPLLRKPYRIDELAQALQKVLAPPHQQPARA